MVDNFISPNVKGIENIVKYKYRATIPKYPKPGTFYWVEQDIEVGINDDGEKQYKKKLSIYFTTNDCELRRLDSKIYSLTPSLDDNGKYIVITEPNEFDEQEIYLVMGHFNKVDGMTEDGVRTFTVLPEDMGVASVEDVVDYVTDSHNMIYLSDEKDYNQVDVRLGDIRIGDNKESLKNNTISEILDKIIYPTLQPEITEPKVVLSDDIIDNKIITIGDSGISSYSIPELNIHKEVNDVLKKLNTSSEIIKYIECSRGKLTYVTEEPDPVPYSVKYYAGEPDLNNIVINIENPSNENDGRYDGRYTCSVSVPFGDGYQPLDNKRNPAKNEELDEVIPSFVGQLVKSNEIYFDVVYPIFANIKSIKTLDEVDEQINYVDKNGEIELEFPSEIDTEKNSSGLSKMTIEIPSHLDFEVYQYNELCCSYDVKKKLEKLEEVSHLGIKYTRYTRTINPTDTKVGSVKYKIIIKKK